MTIAECVATSNSIHPRLPRGLRDILPEQMLARQHIIDTARRHYELYGFVPLDTPAIEYAEVLAGKSDTHKARFGVTGPEGEALGLRFDHTMPLARVIAQHPELPRPVRRYQVAPVWRADKPGKGRFREFIQFDLDSVGVESEIADTEVMAAICDVLDDLGIRYRVRYSTRLALDRLMVFAGVREEQSHDVFRVIDKLDKIGPEKVRLELLDGYADESGAFISGLHLRPSQVDRIEAFLAIKSPRRAEVIAGLRDLFAQVYGARDVIDGLERVSRNLSALGYGDDKVSIDLSVARGLDYYTGTIFETVALDAEEFGSIFGGGRYDDLLARYGERVPAVGAALGVDRLLSILEHLGRSDGRKSTARVLVANIEPSLESEVMALTWELRRAGIESELYLGTARSVGKQLKYADRCGIPLVALYGSDEKSREVVTLKNMSTGRAPATVTTEREEWLASRFGQFEVRRTDCAAAIARILGRVTPGQATPA